MPEYITGYMQTVIDEQEATVKAAITGDRDLVVRAMHISPQLQNKEAAEQLTDELLNAHREYLPQFFNK